jgi:threonine aldolase
MREAMARAEVGDDVYGEDPTVGRLERLAAELVGHEAALFVPTGTMGNQVAIHLHTRPGCDVIVEEDSHVYRYELGAMAAWSGALPRVLRGRSGLLGAEQLVAAVAPDIYYLARTAALVLENSHNHAGGTVLTPDRQDALIAVARENDLRVHLDGARVFNAAASLALEPSRLCAGVDTVMFCLSKGLGAPVGSMLCGRADLIAEARVVRKRMGGGMRQAGILAAAGQYALEHHVSRLVEDHARASRLAESLAELPQFEIDPAAVQTNILIASLRDPASTDQVLAALKDRGVLAGAMGAGRIRFVTHLDIGDAQLDRAIDAVRSL